MPTYFTVMDIPFSQLPQIILPLATNFDESLLNPNITDINILYTAESIVMDRRVYKATDYFQYVNPR